MRTGRHCLMFVLIAALVSCGGGRGPTSATPSPTPAPVPVNGFVLESFSPAAGSTLHMGDQAALWGSFTKEKDEYAAGYATIREDGRGMLTSTVLWSSAPPPWRINGGVGLDPRNGAYDFMRGHTTDFLFVIGYPQMQGTLGRDPEEWLANLDMRYVVFSYRIPTQYRVE